MALNSLSFSKYKNLINVTLDLERSRGVIALAGRNGMGKSNCLEAIVLILQSARRSGVIEHNCPEEYEYDANIKGGHISCRRDKFGFECVINGIKSQRIEDFPRQVVAVYSGDSQRLLQQIESCDNRFVYLNYWTIPFALAILVSSERESVKKIVKEVFHSPEKILIKIKVSNRRLRSALVGNSDREKWRKIGAYRGNTVKLDVVAFRKWMNELGSEGSTFNFLRENWKIGNKGFIKDIEITFRNQSGVRIVDRQLSEGELKLAFYVAIYEFVAEDNSIMLLDEPDAHVHEFWKFRLLTLFKKYVPFNRQTIFTTHSPGLINAIDKKSLVSLKSEKDGLVSASVDSDISDLLEGLGENRMAIYSDRPFVLLEGRSDVKYIEDAIDFLKKEYLKERLCFLSYGGAGDADFLYERLRHFFRNLPIRLYCDKDSGGYAALELMAKVLGVNTKQWKDKGKTPPSPEIERQLKLHGITFIPKPYHISHGEYAVENYLSSDFMLETLNKELKNCADPVCVKTLDKIGDILKRKFYRGNIIIPREELIWFAPLVRSVENFYRSACDVDDIDVSFIVPIVSPPKNDYIRAQIRSFESARTKCPDLKCELIVVDARASGLAGDLALYGSNIVDGRGHNIEEAIGLGFRSSKGSYSCVLWEFATIQDTIYKVLEDGLAYMPDFVMCGSRIMQEEDFALYRVKVSEDDAKKAFEIVNNAGLDISCFCIKRELFRTMLENKISGYMSRGIGLWLLVKASFVWLNKRCLSRWRDLDTSMTEIPQSEDAKRAIESELSRWKWYDAIQNIESDMDGRKGVQSGLKDV